jgi:hypothetical protein
MLDVSQFLARNSPAHPSSSPKHSNPNRRKQKKKQKQKNSNPHPSRTNPTTNLAHRTCRVLTMLNLSPWRMNLIQETVQIVDISLTQKKRTIYQSARILFTTTCTMIHPREPAVAAVAQIRAMKRKKGKKNRQTQKKFLQDSCKRLDF